MSYPLVSIIILTYQNGWSKLDPCLSSLLEIDYKNTEIIIIDNASTDETVSFVKKRFPKVIIVSNKVNNGFCEGNNQAAKIAKGKYLLFLNNDTVVTKNFLSPLVEILEHENDVGVVQPKIRQLIDKEKLDACASFLTVSGFLYHYGYSQNHNKKQYNKSMFIYSVKGACFLTRRSLVDKIGLFDSDYFAYFEETDFCHRVWLSGYKVKYDPQSEIFHIGGGDRQDDHPERLQFISFKNRIQTYLKNLGFIMIVKILSIHIFLCLILTFVYFCKFRFVMAFSIISAIAWNIMNIFKTLKKRATIQGEIRKVSDDKIVKFIYKNPKISYYSHFFFSPRGNYIEREI